MKWMVLTKLLSEFMLLLVYGRNWKDRLDTLKIWVPSLLAYSAFVWLFFLIILPLEPQWFIIGYCLVYPVLIAVWAVITRIKK
ncbi:MAG: hypothetical protein IJD01_08155 [Clostridia bacterium]|nr:hypothetical protein [Clostridia bacterium]